MMKNGQVFLIIHDTLPKKQEMFTISSSPEMSRDALPEVQNLKKTA